MATPLLCTLRSASPSQRATATSMAASLGLERPADDSLSPAQRLIAAARANAQGVSPAVIAVVRANSWGKKGARLTTAFMDNPGRELRREIFRHLNLWGTRANVQFVESALDPMVRIDRRTGREWGGYWSYVGTEILGIPADEPTMNFEGFTMSTPLSEFRRVVCHEAGHTLGFPHEHMRRTFVRRIDPQKAYAHFLASDGWSQQDVDDQVLTPLDGRTLLGTPSDQTSIMCYQLPGSIMRDGKPILGGTRINESDYRFAASIYPLPPLPPGQSRPRRKSKKATTRKSGRRASAKKKTTKGGAKKGVAKRRTSTKNAAKRTTKRSTKRTTKRFTKPRRT
jgi:hypothetical protein